MENEIISFHLAKIEKGREKLCRCNPPHYEIDVVNRIVTCVDCGATIDAFDALVKLTERFELLEEAQTKMIEKAKAYGELAEKEFRRMRKNQVFRNMEESYRAGLFPVCPKCNETIDLVDITRWVRGN